MATEKTGIVTLYKVDKHYGFIKDNQGNQSYFFLLDSKEQIALSRAGHKPISFIRKGDILHFSVRQSLLKPTEKEAHNLIFAGNPVLANLIERYNNDNVLFGQLQKIADKYYVSDNFLDVLLPLKIVHKDKFSENDLDKLLKQTSVTYYLDIRKNPTKVFAKLTGVTTDQED